MRLLQNVYFIPDADFKINLLIYIRYSILQQLYKILNAYM